MWGAFWVPFKQKAAPPSTPPRNLPAPCTSIPPPLLLVEGEVLAVVAEDLRGHEAQPREDLPGGVDWGAGGSVGEERQGTRHGFHDPENIPSVRFFGFSGNPKGFIRCNDQGKPSIGVGALCLKPSI